MHSYLPRRRRRPLLFPPGLLALAGLLWLGCVQLGSNPRAIRHAVLELPMPFLHKPVERKYLDKEYLRQWYASSPRRLLGMKCQTFRLTGLSLEDTIVMRQVIKHILTTTLLKGEIVAS